MMKCVVYPLRMFVIKQLLFNGGKKMNSRSYLNIFDLIISQGEKRGNKYYFEGLEAWHDFDGYTCFLGFKDLTLTLFFHNRSSYDFSNEDTLRQFEKLVVKILSRN